MGLDDVGRGLGSDTMGVDIGDIDLDGAPEIAVTSSNSDPLRLFHCDRALRCTEVSASWGLRTATGPFKWAVGFEDFDLDGDLDRFLANGHIYQPAGQRNQVF